MRVVSSKKPTEAFSELGVLDVFSHMGYVYVKIESNSGSAISLTDGSLCPFSPTQQVCPYKDAELHPNN